MSDGTEAGTDGQSKAPTPGGARVLRWLGMIALIALGLAGLGWVLRLAGRG
jgi:hypothetical protein